MENQNNNKFIFINKDFSYRYLGEDILEEVLDLIVAVQIDSPGNPIFQATKISKEELKNYYRPIITQKCQKDGGSFMDLIFYHKGKISGYVFFFDFIKIAEAQLKQKDYKPEGVQNELFMKKLEIDRLMNLKAYEQIDKTKNYAVIVGGINSNNCMKNQNYIQLQEFQVLIHLQGWDYWVAQWYNPKSVSMMKKSTKYQSIDFSQQILTNPEFQPLVSNFDSPPVFIFAINPLDKENISSVYPERYKQLYEEFQQGKQLPGIQPIQQYLQNKQKPKL